MSAATDSFSRLLIPSIACHRLPRESPRCLLIAIGLGSRFSSAMAVSTMLPFVGAWFPRPYYGRIFAVLFCGSNLPSPSMASQSHALPRSPTIFDDLSRSPTISHNIRCSSVASSSATSHAPSTGRWEIASDGFW